MIQREVTFDASMHSADAIQRAVYSLSDRLSCDISAEDELFRCVVHVAEPLAGDVDAIMADLRNAVIDETLRERIRRETEEVRNLILALAFSNTGLVDSANA